MKLHNRETTGGCGQTTSQSSIRDLATDANLFVGF